MNFNYFIIGHGIAWDLMQLFKHFNTISCIEISNMYNISYFKIVVPALQNVVK